MENLDKLVQLITDRLLENLQNEPEKESILLIGKDSTRLALEKAGYDLVDCNSDVVDLVVVDDLSLDAFLRVASLCPTSEKESALLKHLLNGKKAFVSKEAFNVENYKGSASSLLYRQLVQQKEKLEKYGVTFYQDENLLNCLSKTDNRQVVRETVTKRSETSGNTKTKLITEKRFKELGLTEGDVFHIEKGMIVTALAKDYAKRHKIILN
ncbi:ethanolamine utilization protein [Granulicatella sp. zg-ZJ]|uniref:ethanolamine utilization protein n=1 Tax=unclassified Granulicatella TaxID=2630493 RepID=UPI0013BF8EC1|nr:MULTISPECIES: ethanolamine utilization protein [unclassified Granulicatella]MBS4750690.1 ethanolamine utilization protein [Carnobacteriaceae bacterium zg-ZUI78]NEW61863.1 ethanolamine utilization protein [Granulicatella sp. zg-ZJ]NEW65937.1 ethanolamine utilization protein [Granulicatella sp. zg-84]QMI85163.1 ethanolamine utilization protein [Carnobacteriaceae bacterium zg-84]